MPGFEMIKLTGFFFLVAVTVITNGSPIQKNILISRDQVVFQLYTRDNPNEGSRIIIGNRSTIENTGFNASFQTKILVHGWMDTIDSVFFMLGRREFLALEPMNVIVVAWSECSTTVFYEQAVECAKNVGGYVGELILWLGQVTGLPTANVHALGHSLGGEAISFISKVVRLPHMTALDPAKPLFMNADTENRIDPTDADFVDIFHTSTNVLGLGIATGHVDFYPNGGTEQPGCSGIFGHCAHSAAYHFYAYTIAEANRSAYAAYPCNTVEEAKNQTCRTDVETTVMGYGVSTNTRGIYYLNIPVVPF